LRKYGSITQNDLGKSFGDKTREWEMDTVAKLSKVEDDESAIRLDFLKARLRTPKTAGQFAPLIIRPNDDWKFEIAKAAKGPLCAFHLRFTSRFTCVSMKRAVLWTRHVSRFTPL
jgi:hypothetical protein